MPPRARFTAPADQNQVPVSKIVRLCKDDIRADIAAAEYQRSLDP